MLNAEWKEGGDSTFIIHHFLHDASTTPRLHFHTHSGRPAAGRPSLLPESPMIALRTPVGFLAALVLSALLAGSAGAQEYKIKLMRPQKAGDTYTLSAAAEGKSTGTVTVDGVAQPGKEEAMKVQLDGAVKVLAA